MYNLNVNVSAEEEPAIIVPPAKELKVAEGRNIELTCITSGKPDPIITWRKEGEQITGGRYQIQQNGNLHVQVNSITSWYLYYVLTVYMTKSEDFL